MPHDQSIVGVSKKIYIILSIKHIAQNDEAIWPNSTGKLSECKRLYKQ